MRAIPIINTKTVTLRAMLPQDFARYAEIWARADVVRYVGGQPWDRARAWDSFLRNAGHWQMTGYGQWAVETLGTRQMMGQAGFFLGRGDLGADFDNYPEAGWLLHPDVQGQGLGMDAASAAHDWFDRVVTGPLVCKIAPQNTRSQKIAERLGYRLLRQHQIDGHDVDLLIRKAPPGGPINLLE
jgi:RimJ/RimL family protein N-acetyltransferase